MEIKNRAYSSYADENVIRSLDSLLQRSSPEAYQQNMVELGFSLGSIIKKKLVKSDRCVVAATAEDADYLASGLIDALTPDNEIMAAIFWNNHYSISNKASVAPVVHKYLQPGYETAKSLILVKSILSGSCVVRANIIALIESMNVEKIYIAAPVVHIKSEKALRDEFPYRISSLFDFIYFAKDEDKKEDGEVNPGIGGQIYQLLGMSDQPVKKSFMPKLVERLAFGA